MKHGFIKTACVTPELKVADCEFNSNQIIKNIKEADNFGVTVCAFPELSITGYTCGDLFFQKVLLDKAISNLKRIINETADLNMINIVGLPISCNGKIFNCAAVFQKGNLLALIPKKIYQIIQNFMRHDILHQELKAELLIFMVIKFHLEQTMFLSAVKWMNLLSVLKYVKIYGFQIHRQFSLQKTVQI